MGTRSLTYVKENGKNLLCIYRQYDGYPQGMGKDLYDFLYGFEVVNGFGKAKPKLANGMGCLAAQLVKELKVDTGNVYIYPADSKDVGEEYTYSINLGVIGVNIKVTEVGSGDKKDTVLFKGSIADFGLFLTLSKESVDTSSTAF